MVELIKYTYIKLDFHKKSHMKGFVKSGHILCASCIRYSTLARTIRVCLSACICICDRIWENPPCSKFYEILVSCIFDKLYPRVNLPPSLRPIAHFALELERFVCDRATPTINEKLRSKGVRVQRFRILRVNQKSIKWTWAEPFEMNAKVELVSNFVIDNESRFFFDA